jgi:hypothetical protein
MHVQSFMRSLLMFFVPLVAALACEPIPPSSGFRMMSDGTVPDKPGASITNSMMCSCLKCDPLSCCRELEQEQPEIDKDCSDGYDFSKCEMAVSSCESNCFQHRWRTEVALGCAESRPDTCCHDQDEF